MGAIVHQNIEKQEIPRQHERVPCLENAVLKFKESENDLQVQTKDISFGGVSVSGVKNMRMGAEGKLCFIQEASHQEIWLAIRVRWVRDDEAGLMFLVGSRAQRKTIEFLVHKVSQSVPVVAMGVK